MAQTDDLPRSATKPTDERITVIRPHDSSFKILLTEFVRYRGIFKNLLAREMRRQYIDLRLGFVWVFSQPLLMTIIFSLFRHGSGANIQTDIPYSLYILSGFIFWFCWVDTWRVTSSADRVNAALISKVFFPRLYSPLSAASSKILAFGIGLLPILLYQAYLEVWPSWTFVLVPLVILQGILLAFAVGLIFAVLAMDNRDWDRVQGQVIYLGLFVSPVVYSFETIPESIRHIYALNPMVGTLEAFRSALTGTEMHWGAWAYACAFTLITLLFGVWIFKRAEVRLLDEL